MPCKNIPAPFFVAPAQCRMIKLATTEKERALCYLQIEQVTVGKHNFPFPR